LSARSALTKGFRGFVSESSDRLAFVLISSKGAVRHRSRARCAQTKLNSRVCNLNELLRDCCCRECAESKVFNTEVFEGLPQGVRAGVS
jgi:hypothetical protein